MIIRITNSDAFRTRFEDMGRGNSFSDQGFRVLFDHLDEVLDENAELDVIAIACDYSEMSLDEIWNEYNSELMDVAEINGLSVEDLMERSTKEELTEDFLNERTIALTVEQPYDQPDTYIVAAF